MNIYSEYLTSVGIDSETLINKIEKTFKAATNLCSEQINDIFISDWVDENKRIYENLYLFTTNYIIESANFSTDTNINIEITILKERVKYIFVKYADYFDKANAASRLSIRFYTNGGAYEMRAAKENCDKLIVVYNNYIKPNISKIPIPE